MTTTPNQSTTTSTTTPTTPVKSTTTPAKGETVAPVKVTPDETQVVTKAAAESDAGLKKTTSLVMPEVRCFAFSPPGGLISEECLQLSKECVLSVGKQLT